MENLDAAMSGWKLVDLETPKVTGGSNLIEPTKAEINLIKTALKGGTSYNEIKKTIRRVEKDADGKQISAKGFSYGQIKEIHMAMEKKIAELTPKPKDLNA